jgi:hypothetical protein
MTENEQNWGSLYKIAGIAALIFLGYTLVTMIVLFTIGGPPASVEEGFRMVAENRLTGLLRLDILTILFIPLYYPIFVGLYAALKKIDNGLLLLAAVLALAGLTLFLTAPSTFPFLVLSDKFAAATSEAQRTQLLAAGEAILASDMWHSSSSVMSGLLMQIGALIMTAAMLRGNDFGKLTAWAGIGTYGLDLAHVLVGFASPKGSEILMIISGTLYLLWFPLLARDFFRLARD